MSDSFNGVLSTIPGSPIFNKIAQGKVGFQTVDPQYLDFKALECEYISKDDDVKLSLFELSDVRLYVDLGLIAALVFSTVLQA